MPESSLKKLAFDSRGLPEQLGATAPGFGVSREALLWRLVELELVDRQDANHAVKLLNKNTTPKSKADGAPPFPVLVRSRVGRRFLSTVTEATLSGNLPAPTAAIFLGVRSKKSLQNTMALTDEAV